MFNPDLTRLEGLQRLDKVIENRTETIMRYSTQWFDRPNRITYGWLIYEFVRPGGIVRRKLAPFRLRYHFRKDVERLLQETGFKVEVIFGGYDRKPFTPKSQMMIFVTRP